MITLSDILEDGSLDVHLRAILGFRAWHMVVEHEAELGTDALLHVVQAGDTADTINDALGFAITGPDAEPPLFCPSRPVEVRGPSWPMPETMPTHPYLHLGHRDLVGQPPTDVSYLPRDTDADSRGLLNVALAAL